MEKVFAFVYFKITFSGFIFFFPLAWLFYFSCFKTQGTREFQGQYCMPDVTQGKKKEK